MTQICLSVYMIIGVGVFEAKNLTAPETDIPLFISSLLVSAQQNQSADLTRSLLIQFFADRFY
ncbi:hypothetical protein XENORESO_016436 [Xenotaenia resolanae]|uniref:Uncharacterized protein n=1 Tax=Xenotaenia resolanae TaxID=208358 RepID=A0ABV0W363_9TELE